MRYAYRILLVASLVGGCGVLPRAGHAQNPFGAPTIVGKIVWPDHDLSQAQVRVYKDQALKELADAFPTGGPGGSYVAIVDPGEYYLMAVVDVNGNGKLDAGDGLGYFGVTVFDPKTQKPQPVKLPANGLVTDVHLAITATIGADGKPVPLEGGPPPVEVKPSGLPAAVGGTVSAREDVTAPAFAVLLEAETQAPVAVTRMPPETPRFSLSAPAGAYHLLVLADVSGDGKLGPGDRLGAYGVSDWAKAPPELPTLALGSGDEIGGLEVALNGRLAEEGLVSPAEGTGTLRLDLASLPAIVSGVVRYPGAGLKPTQVRVSADPGMREALAVVPVEAGPGSFAALLKPGTVYLTAIIDENADGKFGAGDLIGFCGVADLLTGAPKPLTLSAASVVSDADIDIVGQVTEGAGLAPLKAKPEAEGKPQQ